MHLFFIKCKTQFLGRLIMVKKLISIVFVFLGIAASAQIPKNEVAFDVNVFPKETVVLSMNSQVLLAGELLQYKANTLNASKRPSLLSKVVYVSLRNQNDSVVFHHKLKVEQGTANGDFFLPSNLSTGIYKLIAYTNFSRNNPQDAFAQKDIYVINTFEKMDRAPQTRDSITITASAKNDFPKVEDNSEALTIDIDKNTYGFRVKITLQVEADANISKGNYTLSVRKINPVEISGQISKWEKDNASEIFYVPELRGELISGVVRAKLDNSPAPNKEVVLTIPGVEYVTKISKTNSGGRFFFSVTEAYNAEKSIVQLYGDEEVRNNYKVVLDSKELKLRPNEPYFLKLDAELKQWLQERSVQLQVENAYFDLKKDSVLKNKINPAFFDDLGTVFSLDDYTRFPTVRETFVEIITLAAIRGKDGESRFVVNNAYDPNGIAKFNNADPLVLMDGMFIQNNTELINYNARDIQQIRVVNEPYRYGSRIFSGIIAVETKKGDFVPKLSPEYVEEISLQPMIRDKKYYRPDYGQNPSLKRIPDYRVQLLWEPNIMLTKGNYETSFYTSDVSGVFEIWIEGFSEEGTYISTKKYFEVID